MADIELKGPPGELRFTLHITRKATGLTETYEMVGHALPEGMSDAEYEAAKIPSNQILTEDQVPPTNP